MTRNDPMSVAVKPDTSACRGNCPSFSPAGVITGCNGQALSGIPLCAAAPGLTLAATSLSFKERKAGPNPSQAPVKTSAVSTKNRANITKYLDFGASGLAGGMFGTGLSGPNSKSNSGKALGNLGIGCAAAGCGGGTAVFCGSGKGVGAGSACFRTLATAAAPSSKPDKKTAPSRLLTAICAPWHCAVMVKTAHHANTQSPCNNKRTRFQLLHQRIGQPIRRVSRSKSRSSYAHCVS